MVQDFASLSTFESTVPDNLKSRISFQAQDILEPNTLHGADVYLLRSILHDWSDKYAILILKNLVPALKDGARILIADFIMPEQGKGPNWVERLSTTKSMQMMTVVNAKERTEEDWADIVRRADQRFELKAMVTPSGAAMAVIEIVFREKLINGH